MNRFLLLLLLVSGCSSIDHRAGPVPGLENMAVEEHRIDTTEIYQRCSSCGDLGLVLPAACTCINFRTKRAVIWLAHNASPDTIEHERDHARGYDHPTGELHRQYAAWLASSGNRPAPQVAQAYRADAVLSKVGKIESIAATP